MTTTQSDQGADTMNITTIRQYNGRPEIVTDIVALGCDEFEAQIVNLHDGRYVRTAKVTRFYGSQIGAVDQPQFLVAR
jgi:hypothetical protein